MMIKQKLFLGLSAVLLLCCAACKKEDGKAVEVSMQPFSTASKVYLDSYAPAWHEGDAVCVNGQSYAVSGGRVTVPNAGMMYVVYPAADMISYSTGTYQVELPRVQCYVADAAGHQHIEALMAASGSGSQLLLTNLCALLKVTAPEDVTVLYIDICTRDSSAAMSGQGSVTFESDGPQFAFGTETYPYTRLDCGAGVCRTDRTYYVAVPPFQGKNLTITLCGLKEGKKFRHTYTQQTASALSRSQYAPAALPAYTFSAADSLYAGTDVLCEPFRISRTKKAYFSKGNLQFRYNGYQWQFAEHQYDMIGDDNSRIASLTSTYTNQWIDLFGWGTSGWSNCATPWEYRYADTYYRVDAAGDDNMSASTDWGANLGGWITPTSQRWDYLLNTRPYAADKKGMAVIDGSHRGLLVLPDYWVLPNGCSFSADATNSYTLAQWDAMEAAGALFLPAAGRREIASVTNVGTHGYYWSGTRENRSLVYGLQFDSTISSVQVCTAVPRLGYSVRLTK